MERALLKLKLTEDVTTAHFLARSTLYSLYALGGISIMGTLGVDTSPLLAGIGVTGITIGFAIREIATNFLSGVLLVLARPFTTGQHIKILLNGQEGKLQGEVKEINSKYVMLKTKGSDAEKPSMLMVPAVVVYTNPIIVSDGDSSSFKTATSTAKK